MLLIGILNPGNFYIELYDYMIYIMIVWYFKSQILFITIHVYCGRMVITLDKYKYDSYCHEERCYVVLILRSENLLEKNK